MLSLNQIQATVTVSITNDRAVDTNETLADRTSQYQRPGRALSGKVHLLL